jgi:hypothetical protein
MGRLLFRVLFRRENRLTQECFENQRGRIFLGTPTAALTWRVLFAGGRGDCSIGDAMGVKSVYLHLRDPELGSTGD